jgi:hypothetical protein
MLASGLRSVALSGAGITDGTTARQVRRVVCSLAGWCPRSRGVIPAVGDVA